MTAASIRLDGAGVRFLFDRQRRVVTPTLAKLRRRGTTVWGVRDVSLDIAPGESIALVGPTGSGKTTLLRLLASVLFPDVGRVDVRGRVGSLLSIQAGLHPVLTGRENATLLGVLAGLTRQESRRRLERVKEQSGLGDAFERAVSSYSQGMRARLGFAVAESAQPQVLLLDEVHEAVDRDYHQVIDEHARAICARGGIVAAAGHDHAVLGRLCDRAVLFREGRVQSDGPFKDVLAAYV